MKRIALNGNRLTLGYFRSATILEALRPCQTAHPKPRRHLNCWRKMIREAFTKSGHITDKSVSAEAQTANINQKGQWRFIQLYQMIQFWQSFMLYHRQAQKHTDER